MLPRLRSDALEVEVLPRLPTVGVCLPRLLTGGQNPSLSPRLRSKAPWTVLVEVVVEVVVVGPLLLEVVVEVVVVGTATTKRNHQAEAVLLEVVVLLWPVEASRQAALSVVAPHHAALLVEASCQAALSLVASRHAALLLVL